MASLSRARMSMPGASKGSYSRDSQPPITASSGVTAMVAATSRVTICTKSSPTTPA